MKPSSLIKYHLTEVRKLFDHLYGVLPASDRYDADIYPVGHLSRIQMIDLYNTWARGLCSVLISANQYSVKVTGICQINIRLVIVVNHEIGTTITYTASDKK